MGGGFADKPFLAGVRVLFMQLAKTHGEVNGDGHGDNQQQGNIVAADNGHLPVHPAQPAGDRQHGDAAAGQRHDHPAGTAENQEQGEDQEDQHADAEHFQVRANKAHQVGGDHGDAAQEQVGVVPVAVHDLAHLVDFPGGALLDLAAVITEGASGVFQRLLALFVQFAVAFLIAQVVAFVEQVVIFLVALEAHQQGGGIAVVADQ